MATDRGTAVASAIRVKEGLTSNRATDYMFDNLRQDAWAMADHLIGTAPLPPTSTDEDGPSDNPVTPEFLVLVGFADPSGSGMFFTIQDADGRELKFTFDGETGGPECHLLDDESDGCRIPAPETEGDMLELCHLLRFPAMPPV